MGLLMSREEKYLYYFIHGIYVESLLNNVVEMLNIGNALFNSPY